MAANTGGVIIPPNGLVLRDYLAATAPISIESIVLRLGTAASVEDIMAEWAWLKYAYADAMIVQRDK